ncbi:hypothetical protein [Vibrio campbellii]|uniref:Uncharacterized protein n=1 Tax=Vibrio campbellii TaxID=680 RepID=A0ACC7RCC7_9VIBR
MSTFTLPHYVTPKNSHRGVSRCQFKAQNHDALAHFIGKQTDRKKIWGRNEFATSPLLGANQQRKHYLYKENALVQFTLTTVGINH